jgi:chemotaxis protein CheX
MQSVLSLPERNRSIPNCSRKRAKMEAAAKISASNQGLAADGSPGQESGAASNRLPQVLDLTQAQNLRDSMAARLSEGPLVLDASAVERMSTPCAQVLLAAGRAADLAGSPFHIINVSDVFRTALADLGLQAEFKNWMV